MASSRSTLPHVIYINLDSRTDRRALIEAELARIGWEDHQITRFPALRHPTSNGAACNFSHAAALRVAHEKNLEHVLILEDDFHFVRPQEEVREALASFHAEMEKGGGCGRGVWDALLLGPCMYGGGSHTEPHSSLLRRCIRSTDASAYMVARHVMLPLSETIEEAAHQMAATDKHWLYQNDVVWQRFMQDGAWFCLERYLGFQRPGFSNLSSKFVDYTPSDRRPPILPTSRRCEAKGAEGTPILPT